jgi:hypothetical protein
LRNIALEGHVLFEWSLNVEKQNKLSFERQKKTKKSWSRESKITAGGNHIKEVLSTERFTDLGKLNLPMVVWF